MSFLHQSLTYNTIIYLHYTFTCTTLVVQSLALPLFVFPIINLSYLHYQHWFTYITHTLALPMISPIIDLTYHNLPALHKHLHYHNLPSLLSLPWFPQVTGWGAPSEVFMSWKPANDEWIPWQKISCLYIRLWSVVCNATVQESTARRATPRRHQTPLEHFLIWRHGL